MKRKAKPVISLCNLFAIAQNALNDLMGRRRFPAPIKIRREPPSSKKQKL